MAELIDPLSQNRASKFDRKAIFKKTDSFQIVINYFGNIFILQYLKEF